MKIIYVTGILQLLCLQKIECSPKKSPRFCGGWSYFQLNEYKITQAHTTMPALTMVLISVLPG